MTVLGIDLGSRNVKVCRMEDDRITSRGCVETMEFYRRYCVRSESGFSVDIETLGCDPASAVVATGYGRNAAAIRSADTVSELTAHFLGARRETRLDDFTLLDMGGQDYKVVRCSGGIMTDFATNDKCAASTGRYLENMAGVLGITLDELGGYSEDPIELSDTCAIFGESELIGHIVRGASVPRLAAGVNRTVVRRVLPLLDRMGGGIIVMSGGVALNPAVVSILGTQTGREVRVVTDPLMTGAIGCCVSGRNR
jgi:(R)-2-hydroxyacyl-CoA dehydratese activating ATPase